jgi:hypothetical protein
MPLLCSEHTWAGRVEVSGSLDEGILTVSISNSAQELWKKVYETGTIEDVSIPELYNTNYTLLLKFQGAKRGKIHLIFKNHKLFGLF